jgi:periplasmic glucans biosynthesis protein
MPAPLKKFCPERAQLALVLSFAVWIFPSVTVAKDGFDFSHVQRIAQDLASRQHVTPQRTGAAYLALNYDTYRLIAPRNDTALWRDGDLSSWAEFFPAGYIFEYPVDIYEVVDGRAKQLTAGPQWFQFRGAAEPLASDLTGGFAGLRLLARLPGNTHKTEYLTFLGASYFRGIGAGDWYGLSARGLAIDTGLHSPEEFPRFIRFWLEKPTISKDLAPQRVWALADSAATAGAFEFVIRPGEQTTLSVNAQIWFRHGVQKVCLAPLTSMWMWDERTMPSGEFRPEVHDSDGLLIESGVDTWIWRELDRPEQSRVETWQVDKLRGFGLLQRDRDREHYQDDEAHYHLRPNAWVATGGEFPWNAGHVELLELPAKNEGMDNIGAYFVVDKKEIKPGGTLAFRYELTFGSEPPWGHRVYPIIDSHIDEKKMTAAVSFDLNNAADETDIKNLEPHATARHGNCNDIRLKSQTDGTIDVTFRYAPTEEKPDSIRVWLTHKENDKTASEIWSYRWITSEI